MNADEEDNTLTFDDLGHYPNDGHGVPRGLTLHELGELLRRLGRSAGFEVQTEFKCTPSQKDAIDWVWRHAGRVVAAFEIEGRDTDKKSYVNDIRKLTSARLDSDGCRVRAIVFFQVNHNLRSKSERDDPKGYVERWQIPNADRVQLFLDEQLLEADVRNAILARARGEEP